MIILDGPNVELRQQLAALFRAQLGPDPSSPEELLRTDLQYLVLFTHQNLDKRVQEGWPVEHLDPAARHMLACSLAACGTLVLYCSNAKGTSEDDFFAKHQEALMEWLTEKFGSANMLHAAAVFGDFNLETLVPPLLQLHEKRLVEVAELGEFYFSGSPAPGAIVLVGEGSQALGGGVRRRAFVSHTGCSLFLHAALRLNLPARYYLTNAQKTGRQPADRALLLQELKLLQPQKVVAMGAEAAAMLSDLKVPHVRTYHPQYWKRFKNKQLDELAQLLAP